MNRAVFTIVKLVRFNRVVDEFFYLPISEFEIKTADIICR